MGSKFLIIISCLVLGLVVSVPAATLQVERGSDLQAVIDYASDGDTLLLGAKTFRADPVRFTDSLCGNCAEAQTPALATRGFVVRNKALTLIGADRELTQLVTRAGYGLFFVGSNGSVVKNLTVTGGVRDADGNATDAGVVVRSSTVCLENVDIRDNDHRIDSVVVGIGGVFGREGAEIILRYCNIVNNGWDGVALYRGASATVTDCLIKNGRGAGIGVTWDATCVAYRNEIRGYWKGIGSFGSSVVIARNNLVHDNLGWGIIATGSSWMDASNNLVHHNGNCGVASWSSESRGRFINNIITDNGWREQWVCPCVGVMNSGDWAKFDFRHNIVWGNEAGEYQGIWDQTGIEGNLSVDPMFADDVSFEPQENSPTWNGGDSLIFNTDGTRSHIGPFGGPQGRTLFPLRVIIETEEDK